MSNNIVLKKGTLYYSLDDGDIIRPTDLVREYSSEKSPYKSAEYYPVYFHTAIENMPGWVGKTVGEFHSAILKLGITELDILREFEL